MKEPRVIADMAEEDLMLNSGVGVCERAPLWFDNGTDAFNGCDNVESCIEVVVCKG